jgi:NAD(P)H dehydrogenase (quinone)
MSILITGASGVTGTAILRHLVARGRTVHALTSNRASADRLESLGAQPRIADLRGSQESLVAAMRGIERVYHVCPVLSLDELAIGRRVITAAREAGVAHFVYHSVMAPFLEEVPFHWEKMKVEAELLHSGLPFTVIQPTNYMQNVEWTLPVVLRTGRFGLPYSASAKLSWVDLEDVGEAAANILTEPGHAGATYPFCGTDEPLDRHQIASLVAQRFGRPVEAVTLSADEVFAQSRFAAFDPRQLAWGRAMFEHYDRHGFACGNPRVLAMLLGRPTRRFEDYLARLQAPQVASHPSSMPSQETLS